MKHGWKRIFRWFRISNQIFHSIYRSRVIRRSLDLVLAVLTKNANFMDEYLENGASFWRAVFFCWSVSFSSTLWPKIIKIVRVVFEKKSKNGYFHHIFVLYGWTDIFFENPALSLCLAYRFLTSCQKSGKSLEAFLRYAFSNYYQQLQQELNWRWELLLLLPGWFYGTWRLCRRSKIAKIANIGCMLLRWDFKGI